MMIKFIKTNNLSLLTDNTAIKNGLKMRFSLVQIKEALIDGHPNELE